MKITKIELLLANPVEDHWQPAFCRIYTDTGIYGDGEITLSYGHVTNAAFAILKDFAQMLIGCNPLEHEVIWQKLYRKSFFGINGGPLTFGAISAFDIALWDIKGKYYNAPVYELLGGKQRDKLRCYASQLQNGIEQNRKPARTFEDYANQATLALKNGFDAVKYNFLTFREDDGRYDSTQQTAYLHPKYLKIAEGRIKAVREVLGEQCDIILENHCYTDVESAVQFGNMAKKYGILYYEEPTIPNEDLLLAIHQRTKLPIASGERLYSRWQFKRVLDKRAVQVIQPDLGTCGGITEAKKICDMAYTYEAGVQIHVCGSPLVTSASLHFESTLPNFVLHEYNVNTMLPKMVSLAKHNPQPENGYYVVSNQPGIGNEISDIAYKNSQVITIE